MHGPDSQPGTTHSVSLTHVGLVRSHNEDAVLDRPDLALWAVADGMGGMTAGEVASHAVVDALNTVPAGLDAPTLLAEIRARISGVNTELLAMAAARGPDTVIGTTIAGLVLHSGWYACFWAGDSRIYRARAGTLEQLTRDHSLVQDMVDAGTITPEAAERHPHASVIQRAVGVDEEVELQWAHARIEPGDTFLLCSDGLTRMVPDPEIAAALRTPIEAAAPALLARTLERGAKDNVSLVLVAVS